MATETEVGELLHQRGWRTAFTVAETVNAWAALVSVIERGYGDDIYEYTNDLSCRDWLHWCCAPQLKGPGALHRRRARCSSSSWHGETRVACGSRLRRRPGPLLLAEGRPRSRAAQGGNAGHRSSRGPQAGVRPHRPSRHRADPLTAAAAAARSHNRRTPPVGSPPEPCTSTRLPGGDATSADRAARAGCTAAPARSPTSLRRGR
ncbi:hypothetical protein FRZ00_13660 [Streptomyces mobaraensis]|uniref:Uncharacterized protein n=1 Tax=Streptomyces mobaraensis TaxID=35621 RepID=A0A5N5W8A7_STRMB|nr:hypothetical protein FRZ00_13660 [Streptomyces mobaraensis]